MAQYQNALKSLTPPLARTVAKTLGKGLAKWAARRGLRATVVNIGMTAGMSIGLSCSASALAEAAPADATLVARGQYLATAADCMACHTALHGGKPFAGGYGIQTPIGLVYSSNITPSKTAGIGNYSEAQFAAALREGIRGDGAHLYPAMPYTSYAKLSDEDVHALYTYFMHGVQPVDTAIPVQTDLKFPFDIRTAMAVWNLLYLDNKPAQPDASKSAEWNRGQYLVKALAHCATCHTPRNEMMAERTDVDLAGAPIGGWFAPNITSDKIAGVGGWSHDELYRYLKTGVVAGKAQAAGPMAEAIENSLQHLTDADLNAIVTYLQDTAPVAVAGLDKPRYAYGKPSDSEFQSRGLRDADPGWKVFTGSCAACHQARGTGVANGDYPSLFHNTATGAERADNLISTILYGFTRKIGEGTASKTAFMPGFGPQASYTERLSDQEVADVSNYVLATYGNSAVKVTPQDVATIRNGGPTPLIAKVAPYAPVAIVVVVLLLVVLLAARRRRKHARG